MALKEKEMVMDSRMPRAPSKASTVVTNWDSGTMVVGVPTLFSVSSKPMVVEVVRVAAWEMPAARNSRMMCVFTKRLVT